MSLVKAICEQCGGGVEFSSNSKGECIQCGTLYLNESATNVHSYLIENAVVMGGPQEESLLERACEYLARVDFAKADEYVQRVLDINPRNETARNMVTFRIFDMIYTWSDVQNIEYFDLPNTAEFKTLRAYNELKDNPHQFYVMPSGKTGRSHVCDVKLKFNGGFRLAKNCTIKCGYTGEPRSEALKCGESVTLQTKDDTASFLLDFGNGKSARISFYAKPKAKSAAVVFSSARVIKSRNCYKPVFSKLE